MPIKYGLSSLETANGYVRGGIERLLTTDEGRKFGLGYGLDVVLPINYTSKAIIQQAYVEGRWWHGTLTIGAKEEPMELKNNELSSGSQTLGINARPVHRCVWHWQTIGHYRLRTAGCT